ncbi:unnamed protein product [Mytilus edulis]|uniref:Uncharacterized protein n=1 Tax=Mytilus edulis TaxID=6550 RepID=A0A8S3TZ97_MYTED|nr:unnamed protein product [Mytilus edulis]
MCDVCFGKKLVSCISEPAATIIKPAPNRIKPTATRVKQTTTRVEQTATRIKQAATRIKQTATRIKRAATRIKTAAIRIKQIMHHLFPVCVVTQRINHVSLRPTKLGQMETWICPSHAIPHRIHTITAWIKEEDEDTCKPGCPVTNEDFLKEIPTYKHLRRLSVLYSNNDARELAIHLELSTARLEKT